MRAMAITMMWVALLLAVPSAKATSHNAVVIGQTSIAGGQDPTDGSTGWSLISHGVAEKLFTVDRSGNIVGQVAESCTKIDDLTWDVTLRSNYEFSDGTVVTAEHVANCTTWMNSVNSGAQSSVGTMTVTARDASTVRIVTERATPVMDSVLAEWAFPVFRFVNGGFIFTGPYAIDNFDPGVGIALIPNVHYSQAAERPLITLKLYADQASLASALVSGTADMAFHLSVNRLAELRAMNNVTVKTFGVGYHYMMIHNTRSASHLSDVNVRRAVDLALDRDALTQALRAGSGTRSFFPQGTPWYVESGNAHGDRSAAEALLETAGWARPAGNANGVRMKAGFPLNLRVVAYAQRPGLVLMLPEIATMLTAIGINVTQIVTSGASWDELDAIMDFPTYSAPTFDLLLWAQNTLPAGDPQWFFNAFFRSDGGSNYAALNSTTIDGLLHTLGHTDAHAARVTAAAAVSNAVYDQVPISNLMTPEWHVGLSSRLSSYTPWGSDYYVIRSDLFVSTADTTVTTTAGETTANRGSWAVPGALSFAVVLCFAF